MADMIEEAYALMPESRRRAVSVALKPFAAHTETELAREALTQAAERARLRRLLAALGNLLGGPEGVYPETRAEERRRRIEAAAAMIAAELGPAAPPFQVPFPDAQPVTIPEKTT